MSLDTTKWIHHLFCFWQVDTYCVWVNAKKMFDQKAAEAEKVLSKRQQQQQQQQPH